MAFVICAVFLTERMRRRMSRVLGIYFDYALAAAIGLPFFLTLAITATHSRASATTPESMRSKPAEAIGPLRHAAELAPNPGLIQIMLGQALIATRDRGRIDEAITLLQSAVIREPESPDVYSQLAMAYGQKNDIPAAV